MRKKLFKEMPMVTASAIGILCSGIISALLLLLCASMINSGHAEIDISSYIAPLIHGAATLAGCVLSGKLAEGRRGVACALSAAGYLVLLFLIALLFMDGIHGQILWGTAAIACGFAGATVICTVRNTRKKKKVKSRFR